MKLLDRNARQGLVKVIIDNADDLWYLHTIIDAGDSCTGDSEYKYKLGGAGAEGKSQIIKKKVWVSIEVEKTEFSSHAGVLRVNGKVIDGSEDVPRGSYHSLDVTEGTKLTIIKHHWHEFQTQKLEEAVGGSGGKTLVVLFDRETAIFAMLTPQGHTIMLTLKGDVPRKGVDEGRQHTFYSDIVKHLDEFAQRHGAENVVAASPSFWKGYLEKELTPALRKKTTFTAVSAVDETAIGEVLRRPELEQALRQQRSTLESQLIERILAALAKDKLVYGMKDLETALAEGNLSELTVSETKIAKDKEDGVFDRLEQLLRAASDIKARVHLVSTEQATLKIDGLGGVVGVKRW